MAESKNNSLFMFLEKKMDEEKISDAQRSMIYKNFLYILTLFKSEWGLDKKIDAPMYVSKYPNLKSTAELTTFPTIWHKVKLALERSTNNTINFRNAIIDEIKLNDEGEKKNCETSRNNFLNLQ